MNAQNGTVAESLTPPFVAAIFSDTAIVRHLEGEGRRPSDEMVSMAPTQSGFLGLETSRDEKGRWLSVCYWRDMAAYNGWRNACVDRMAAIYPDAHLESLCQIRVATVDRPVQPQRRKHLKADTPAPTSEHPDKIGRLFNAFPAIAELFGHAHVR
jgi:heme-degrading monooxygenase HmoA